MIRKKANFLNILTIYYRFTALVFVTYDDNDSRELFSPKSKKKKDQLDYRRIFRTKTKDADTLSLSRLKYLIISML